MTSAGTYVFNHPELGEIHGLRRLDDVIQYRGLPFADIPGRFRQARLRTDLPATPFNGTSTGPVCPQSFAVPFPQLWGDGLEAPGIRYNHPPEIDEFKCLNLNVTAPAGEVNKDNLLPVMIFIHGGGFVAGSTGVVVAGREVYDPAYLVQKSRDLRMPIIVVAINYRLGPLGFLASEELKAFNENHTEAVGNYGLHDQRIAIEWVQKFIAGFGGDPENITLQGASAGGASSHFQALFPGTKVKRAILASGTALAIGAMPLAYHQQYFDTLSRQLCEGEHDPLAALQSVSAGELVRSWNGMSKPLIDDDWIRGRTMSWLQQTPTPIDLMIGSCEYETDVCLAILGYFSPDPPDSVALTTNIQTALIPSGLTSKTNNYYANELLSNYGLSFPISDPSSIQDWASYIADIIFRVPPYLIAAKSSKNMPSDNSDRGRVYLYEFKARSPYPDWRPGYGKAHHAVTDVFLFDVAADLVPSEHLKQWERAVDELQRAWIEFCWGKLGWEAASDRVVGTGHEVYDALPVYDLENDGSWELRRGVKEVVGLQTAAKWKELLTIAEEQIF